LGISSIVSGAARNSNKKKKLTAWNCQKPQQFFFKRKNIAEAKLYILEKKNVVYLRNQSFSFFWDNVHPSHNGWNSVYTLLQPSLGQLIDKN
jgi:hypothetical protein